jgi:anaerobic magnesium-protoporphyrin IX monomethyl ester cyclase
VCHKSKTKMKIVFINPSLRPDAKRRLLPVGLAYVMTAAKNSGFEFDLIDMDIDQLSMHDLEEILGCRTYDVYAFGCIVTGFKQVKEISRIVKSSNPQATVIAGNSVATSIPEILLNNTMVDIAILGEGDNTIVELLKVLEKGNSISGVQGIAFKENSKIVHTPARVAIPNLDVLGFPDWDLFELEKYNEYSSLQMATFVSDQTRSYPLNAARGCPFNCSFCYHVFKDQKYRKYSEEAVMNEIKRLHDRYNCNHISFWDELTFHTIKSASVMAEKIRNLDFEISWEAPTRGNLFKEKDVELIKGLKESGCSSISFSLENASSEILKAMNKKMNVSQFIEQVKALWDGGVTPLTSVVFGYPQETPETIQKTLDVCEACGIYPSVGFLLPLPATPIYEWAKENGYIDNEVEYLERIGDRQDFHINLTAMSDEEFVETVTTKLEALAEKQGLEFESVFKTVTYQKPKSQWNI